MHGKIRQLILFICQSEDSSVLLKFDQNVYPEFSKEICCKATQVFFWNRTHLSFVFFSLSFFGLSLLCVSLSFLSFSLSFFGLFLLCISLSFLFFSLSFFCLSLLSISLSFLFFSLSFFCLSLLSISLSFLFFSLSFFGLSLPCFFLSVFFFSLSVFFLLPFPTCPFLFFDLSSELFFYFSLVLFFLCLSPFSPFLPFERLPSLQISDAILIISDVINRNFEVARVGEGRGRRRSRS